MKNTKAKAPKAKSTSKVSLVTAARHILSNLSEDELKKVVKAFTPKATVAPKAKKASTPKAKKASAPKAKAKKATKGKTTRKLSRKNSAQGETLAA